MEVHDLRRNYDRDSLRRGNLAKTPLEQFRRWFAELQSLELPAWFELNSMTLSTADAASVTSRIVLLKEFGEDGFVFFTNYESLKSRQIEASPRVALNFYWAPLERQVRIEGVAERTDRETSRRYFDERPRGSRLGAMLSPQSSVIPDDLDLEAMQNELSGRIDRGEVPLECPEDWGGWRVRPTSVEFWQGRPSRLHDRYRYRLDDSGRGWTIERLAP